MSERSGFVPREAVVASGVFARARMLAGVRGGMAMYVDRTPVGYIARFEAMLGGVRYGFAAMASEGQVAEARDVVWMLAGSMARSWMDFIRKADSHYLQSWTLAELSQ
jgi:hypothetical protein